jgi:hypothetical protein
MFSCCDTICGVCHLIKFCMRFAERASACGGILGVGNPVFHSGSNFCNTSTVAYENITEIVSSDH